MFPPINLPYYHFRIKQINSKWYIFDEIREQYVRLTPEEWVRQHFIMYLIRYKNYPKGLISVEYAISINKNTRRSDIVVFSKNGKILCIIECKSYEHKIDQKVFDQIFIYNMPLKVSYLMITNGMEYFCCKIHFHPEPYLEYLNEIPDYKMLIKENLD